MDAKSLQLVELVFQESSLQIPKGLGIFNELALASDDGYRQLYVASQLVDRQRLLRDHESLGDLELISKHD